MLSAKKSLNTKKCDSVAGNKESFDDIQWQFEVVRAAGDSVLCPLLGFLVFGSRFLNLGYEPICTLFGTWFHTFSHKTLLWVL